MSLHSVSSRLLTLLPQLLMDRWWRQTMRDSSSKYHFPCLPWRAYLRVLIIRQKTRWHLSHPQLYSRLWEGRTERAEVARVRAEVARVKEGKAAAVTEMAVGREGVESKVMEMVTAVAYAGTEVEAGGAEG